MSQDIRNKPGPASQAAKLEYNQVVLEYNEYDNILVSPPSYPNVLNNKA